MITLQDIQTAVAAKLIKNGYTVTANEVTQGFNKPTFFIDVLPVSAQLQGKFYEMVTVSVEITYHPEIETREELLRISEQMKQFFLYESVPVCDRFLSTDEMVFDTDKSALTAYFELEFMQETNITEKEYPKMKQLQTEVKQNNGTATDHYSV
ncbi:MAG: hypothetical protein Q8873_00135 [Bacillota bacterium]|nr:hypothetical protein [Bacillota bacterium]